MVDIIQASGQYTQERRTHWKPKLRAGHFSVRDRRYYLYANKRTIYYRETKQLRHPLAGLPTGSGIAVKVGGVPWSNYYIHGRDLVVSLEDLESSAGYWASIAYDNSNWDHFKFPGEFLPDNQITIAYQYIQWNSTTKAFDANTLTETFRIGDCELSHQMPSDFVGGAPIVITGDDRLQTDEADHQIQFKLVPPRELQFNMASNYLRNPHFAVYPSGHPTGLARWYVNDPAGIARTEGTGYVGTAFLRVDGTGKVLQEAVVASGMRYVAEVWHRTFTSGTAILELAYKTSGSGIPIVDQTGAVLAYDPNLEAYSYRKTAAAGSGWAQLAIPIGTGTEFDPTEALFPDTCDRIEFRIWASGQVDFGAARLIQGDASGEYCWINDRATVEYETDPSGFYRHVAPNVFPYETLWSADLNPVNMGPRGVFVAVVEGGDPTDQSLGIGELEYNEPHAYAGGYPQGVVPWQSGTLHEFGRRHLPYAKIDGFQKFRQSQEFDLVNQPASLVEVTEPAGTPVPARMMLSSPCNLRRNDADEPVIAVKLLSSLGHTNEYVALILMDRLGNRMPGEWVQVTPSGDCQVAHSGEYTDRAGRMVVHVGPTDGATGTGLVQFIHTQSGKEARLWTSLETQSP
jgi:hypothetical protein